jgi:hypothetical protein
MAGVKITDLTTITSAASNDLLYIVDVSNTTQSPEGTSSQIELGNVVAIESGTWTPTITTDYEGYVLFSAIYTRVNNSVSFIIKFALNNNIALIDFGTTTFSPPNGLTPSTDCCGIMAFHTNSYDIDPTLLSFTITADGVNIIFAITTNLAYSAYPVTIQGTYLIA